MRILFIASRPPWPSRRGDQARLAGWIRELGVRHQISVVAQRPPGFPRPSFPPAVRGLDVGLGRARILGSLLRRPSLPLQVAWHYQPELAAAVSRAVASFRPDVAVVVLARLGWVLPALGDVPTILDLVDSLALNMRRRADRQPLLAALWHWEARRIEGWERAQTRRVRRAVVVSGRDRDAVAAGDDELRQRIEVIRFGVPLVASLPEPAKGEPIVLLSGNLGYFPTRDGALWMAREVWPRVLRACPQARWWLAGSRPGRALRRLARLPGVRVVAEPEDLTAIRRQAAVAVAPMRAGSGTPIKIFEAMADGLPVVATPQAASGLEGLGGGELAVSGDSETFAAALVRLLEDSKAAAEQAASARSWLREHHDLRRVASRFEKLLEAAVAGR